MGVHCQSFIREEYNCDYYFPDKRLAANNHRFDKGSPYFYSFLLGKEYTSTLSLIEAWRLVFLDGIFQDFGIGTGFETVAMIISRIRE